MSNVIEFPKTAFAKCCKEGNGGYEAFVSIVTEKNFEATEASYIADYLLVRLWQLGFKVVPLDGTE